METKDKFEYFIYQLEFCDRWRDEEVFNEFGADGWELVAVTGNNTHCAFFKRRCS